MNDSSDIKLWAHQEATIQKSKKFDHFALFLEPGTGKTLTLIKILEGKYKKEKGVIKTLILCPLVVCENWKREFAKYSDIPQNQIEVLEGTGAAKTRQLKHSTKDRIIVTNYDALHNKDLFEALFHFGFKALVLDESHRIKDHTAKRSKKCMMLAKHTDYRYILSGTPITNTVTDLFSQFLFLDNGQTLGTNFYKFRATHFDDKNRLMPRHIYFPNWVEKSTARKDVGTLIEKKSFHVKKSEALDLPPLIEQELNVALSDTQLSLYKQMEKEFICIYNGEAVTATIALTKILRMRQIISGFVKAESGEESGLIGTPRVSALSDLLEDRARASKIIVWAVFKFDYAQIATVCKNLKLDYLELNGETKNKDFVIHEFNTNQSVRVLIAHPGSGGIGVNLTASDTSIWYSRSYSYEQDEQANARNYRGGSEIHEKITRIDLVAKDTVDEVILNCVKQKITNATEILNLIRNSI